MGTGKRLMENGEKWNKEWDMEQQGIEKEDVVTQIEEREKRRSGDQGKGNGDIKWGMLILTD